MRESGCRSRPRLTASPPRVLPLIAVLTTWWMINKKQFSPTKVIIVFSVVVAIACLLGVF